MMWEEENHLPLGAIMLSGHQKATHFTVFVLVIFIPLWRLRFLNTFPTT